ncbi:MAG: hypothetical protein ABIQ90_11700, partial [Polaromonas sp.]
MTARLSLLASPSRPPNFFSLSIAMLMLSLAVSATWLSGCGQAADAQGGPPPAAPVSVAPAVQRTVS